MFFKIELAAWNQQTDNETYYNVSVDNNTKVKDYGYNFEGRYRTYAEAFAEVLDICKPDVDGFYPVYEIIPAEEVLK